MVGHQPPGWLAGILGCLGRSELADDATGEQIDNGWHRKPALTGSDVGEVGAPFAVRRKWARVRIPRWLV
jgi:hypothetical protein